MSLAKHIVDRLIALGATAEVKGLEVVVTVDDVTTRLRIEDGADDAFESYRRARSSAFDVDDWSYTHNATVELPLARLDPDVYRDTDDTTFTDEKGNTVTIHRASRQYMFAHFDSPDYERYFTTIVYPRFSN